MATDDANASRHSHHTESPSDWVARWAGLLPAACGVLDVACGGGRHARFLAARGHRVDAVDRDAAALEGMAGVDNIKTLCADIEGGPWPYPWPYAGRTFGAVVVTNYLYRPLLPALIDALAPGGVLIYETFALGNERYGRPANPDFLLRPGELLDVVCGKLRVIAYEDIYVDAPKPAMVQRICARR